MNFIDNFHGNNVILEMNVVMNILSFLIIVV